MTSGFDLGHDLDLEFSRSNIEFAISQPKMVRLPRNEKQTYWLNSRPQMWPMVWIYQIVTGVTSVVGVPSTHLAVFQEWGGWLIWKTMTAMIKKINVNGGRENNSSAVLGIWQFLELGHFKSVWFESNITVVISWIGKKKISICHCMYMYINGLAQDC